MPSNPPPEVPIVSYPTPQVADRLLVELKSTELGDYAPLHPGTPHPDLVKYPGFVFVSQQSTQDEKWIRRVWINDRETQDTYNAAKVSYVEDSAEHPIFVRHYLERRGYTPRTRRLPLTGVVRVAVVSGGAGYATAPDVSLTGGAGSGAAAFAVIFRGEVVGVIITAEGSDYTSAPNVTFSGGNPTTTASATAHIQPATAVLVKEEEQRLEDSPLDGLFVSVSRIYHTLPGPEVLTQSIGEESLIPAEFRRQIRTVSTEKVVPPDTILPATLNGDQTQIILVQESTTLAKQTVVEEVIQENTDPNVGYRIDEQGILTITRRVVPDGTTLTGDITIKDGQIVPLGNGKSIEQIQTYEQPFPDLEGTHVDEATGISVHYFKTIVAAGTNGGVSGAFYTEVQPIDKWRSVQIVSSLNENSLPADFTFETIVRHSFPDVIQAAGMVPQWLISTDGTSNAIGLTINPIQGYSGPCNARVKEKYLTAAEFALYTAPVITKFWPQGFSFPAFTYAGVSRVDVSHFNIPVSLHPAKTLTFDGFGFVDVPATNPTTLPFGSYIYIDVQPERWRFGVWKVSEIEVLVPIL